MTKAREPIESLRTEADFDEIDDEMILREAELLLDLNPVDTDLKG